MPRSAHHSTNSARSLQRTRCVVVLLCAVASATRYRRTHIVSESDVTGACNNLYKRVRIMAARPDTTRRYDAARFLPPKVPLKQKQQLKKEQPRPRSRGGM